MTSISVLTITHQRTEALHNLIRGLDCGQRKPDELVIISMNEEITALPEVGFPVRTYRIDRDGYLPLGEARNLAVEQASFEHLVFLDVDCIPAASLIEKYLHYMNTPDQLYVGPVRYLDKGATDHSDLFFRLNELSKPDPIRSTSNPIVYELFWSLNFGCTKSTFFSIGGFDKKFTGYGAEDTDFAFSARNKNILIQWIDATAYHQYHASYDPPLNHIKDIVANALVFKHKWNSWPMTGWLKKFAESGYVTWENDTIHLRKLPSAEEIALAIKT